MSVRSNVPIKLGPLVTIDVTVNTSLQAESEDTHVVCDAGHDPARIKSLMRCPECATEGNQYTFPRGVETDGKIVVLAKEDLPTAAEDVKGAMIITAHPRVEVMSRAISTDSPYVLTPGKKDANSQGYALLLQLVTDDPDTALCTVWASRSKPAMYVLNAYDSVLTLQKLAWPEDVKALPVLHLGTPDKAMLKLGKTVINTIRKEFTAAGYRDDQRVQREALVSAKAAESVPLQSLPAVLPSNVSTGLLAALQATVKANKPKPARAASGRYTRKKASA